VPKAPPPTRQQRDCRFDNLVAAAISRGYGITLRYTGIETLERGHEIRRGIYRCARHREVSADAGPSKVVDGAAMGLHAAGGGYELLFRIWSKSSGRARVLATYGPDRSSWAYDPRRPKNQEDVDYWAELGLNEKGHRIK